MEEPVPTAGGATTVLVRAERRQVRKPMRTLLLLAVLLAAACAERGVEVRGAAVADGERRRALGG